MNIEEEKAYLRGKAALFGRRTEAIAAMRPQDHVGAIERALEHAHHEGLRAIVAVLCLAWPLAAHATSEGARKGATGIVGDIARKACLGQTGRCTQSRGCDTGVIECLAATGTCTRDYGTCLSREGGARCEQAFTACARPAISAVATSVPRIAFAGGDGSSMETALVIVGARNEMEGVLAENLWALRLHPDWRNAGQSLIHGPDRRLYDRMEYRSGSDLHVVWFDITGFFGRM